MNNTHQIILEQINPDFVITSRFNGGMSNYTYLVTDNTTRQYTFRIPGTGANNFCNYDTEKIHLEKIEHLNINSTTIYFNPNTGIKISDYIIGETLSTCKFTYGEVVKILNILHNSNIDLTPYNHFNRLDVYEKLANNNSITYQKLRKQFTTFFDRELKDHIHYPCHCDAQQSNFIYGNKLYLLDWEFAGQNDYIYDIASFGNVDFEDALNLLKAYHPIDFKNYYFRLYAWRGYQCLQWYNVALYKHQIGLGNDLGIDFDFVSKKYLNLAAQMLDTANNYS